MVWRGPSSAGGGLLVALLAAVHAPAQDPADALAAARARVDAGEVVAALELLAPLRPPSLSEREQYGVAELLVSIGQHLRAAGDLASAARAHAAALAMRRALHGEMPHPDVAGSAGETAFLLLQLDRPAEALPHARLALQVQRQLRGDADHVDVARAENNVAFCLAQTDQADEALQHAEQALAMCRRLAGDRDDPGVAHCLDTVAGCLRQVGRASAALPLLEENVSLRRRLAGDGDHPLVERAMNNLAVCLQDLGRFEAALAHLNEALAMHERLRPGRDQPELVTRLGNRASCLSRLGRTSDALRDFEAALAMARRLHGTTDHPQVGTCLADVGFCLDQLGRPDLALPYHEDALAMRQRLAGDADTDVVAIASSRNNLAACLQSLGRHAEALPLYEASAAMRQRIHGDRPHPEVALAWNNLAYCLTDLGRPAEALAWQRRALAMQRELHPDRDHPEVAQALHNLGSLLVDQGDVDGARACLEESLAIRRRLFGDGDHPAVVNNLQGLAHVLWAAGRNDDADTAWTDALARRRRIFGDIDHPDLAGTLAGYAVFLSDLGRWDAAKGMCTEACAMIERLRERNQTDGSLRQSWFDEQKRFGPFETLQTIHLHLDEPEPALAVAERARGRGLLDLCEQQRFDPLDELLRRARQRGDDATAALAASLQTQLADADAACDQALHAVTQSTAEQDGAARPERGALLKRLEEAHRTRRQLLDRRARLCADVLPVGRVRSPAEIRAHLRAGEALLEFTLADAGSIAYLVTRERVEAFRLPQAHAAVRDLLPEVVDRMAHAGPKPARGRDPSSPAKQAPDSRASEALFAALIPPPLWVRLQQLSRVHIAAHRALHRLPFEALVSGRDGDEPVWWLDRGPPIAYVQSGSTLCWLRERAAAASDDATGLDLLVVGDPAAAADTTAVPQQGAMIVAVDGQGPGARAGLLPRDVVIAYDGRLVHDDRSLRDLRAAVEAAIEDGARSDTAVPLTVWRQGKALEITIAKGPLGVEVARGPAGSATDNGARVTRDSTLERLLELPPLLGARTEAAAIERLFGDRKLRVAKLLGDAATESAVFDRAANAKFVHFACHGIAEEFAGQSFSMLVLAKPATVLPGDDGLLQLHELLGPWRGRLASNRLVVLSACRTNVGPTLRDEAPQALPTGLLFAGASSVVSSLWAVDDASTSELMTDFYGRLLAGEADRLQAFWAAKQSLRQKYRDPFHWAPFCYLGSPD